MALEEIRGEGWRDEIESLDPAEAPGVLARFVHHLVEPLLGSLTGKDSTARQLEIVNDLLVSFLEFSARLALLRSSSGLTLTAGVM